MPIIPWPQQRQPSPQSMTLRDAMSHLFDDAFWDPMHFFSDGSLFPALTQATQFMPRFDLAETDKEIQVIADVPGYDPKDVNVHLENGVLTIEGKMEEDTEENDKRWYCREASRGSFFRQISVPHGVEEKDVKCKMKNGKLTVTITKKGMSSIIGKTLKIEAE